MAKYKGIRSRMQDFYFEISNPDGSKQIIGDDPDADIVKLPEDKKSQPSKRK
jgi:hypothetical protein